MLSTSKISGVPLSVSQNSIVFENKRKCFLTNQELMGSEMGNMRLRGQSIPLHGARPAWSRSSPKPLSQRGCADLWKSICGQILLRRARLACERAGLC